MFRLVTFAVLAAVCSPSLLGFDGVQMRDTWRNTEHWSYKFRLYFEDPAGTKVLRSKRDTYKTGYLTDNAYRTKDAILKAIEKGGDLEQEGFRRNWEFQINTKNLEFYRCFKSFAFILEELKEAYKSRTHSVHVEHIVVYDTPDDTDTNSNLTSTEKPDRKASTRRINGMFTVSNVLLDDKGNKDLIKWLEKQVKGLVDRADGLWNCKARVIVQYRCCWSVFFNKILKHWGEVHVLVG